MIIACTGYVSYGVVPLMLLHSVIADIVDNAPSPQLVRYNEGLLYLLLRWKGFDNECLGNNTVHK
jgi:hypothetical protein